LDAETSQLSWFFVRAREKRIVRKREGVVGTAKGVRRRCDAAEGASSKRRPIRVMRGERGARRKFWERIFGSGANRMGFGDFDESGAHGEEGWRYCCWIQASHRARKERGASPFRRRGGHFFGDFAAEAVDWRNRRRKGNAPDEKDWAGS